MEYFKDANVGDKVWSANVGWGKIVSIINGSSECWMLVLFEIKCGKYYRQYNDGVLGGDTQQTLFWDEIKFELPSKPKVEVKHESEYWVLTDKKGIVGGCYREFSSKQEAEEVAERCGYERYVYPAKIKKEWSVFE